MRLTSHEQTERVGWSVKSWNRLNFLTATLAERETDPRVISNRWHRFCKYLRLSVPGLRVIRVLQRHPGGHGWHVHALLDRRVSSDLLLHCADLAGLGRMDFQMVTGEQRQNIIRYVSRYVTRDLRRRPAIAKGIRMLTASGPGCGLAAGVRWWRRLVDLCIESNAARLRDSLRALCALHGLRLERSISSLNLFALAPPAALAEWRALNEGFAF